MDNEAKTEVTFLGTDSVVPECGADTASFVMNRRYLVDTGWYAAIKMRCYGLDPLDIEYLFFTHCHHDHYLGLPHLLFYRAMRASERPELQPLKILGPAGEIERIVHLTQEFLQMERYQASHHAPKLIPLQPGDTFDDPRFHLATCPSVHTVPGLCYRFTDKETGKVLALSGDTRYNPPLISLAAKADLLIHEASYGASPSPEPDPWMHSGAPEAARVAQEAGIQRLALVHCPGPQRAEALKTARALFPNTFWPGDGESVPVE